MINPAIFIHEPIIFNNIKIYPPSTKEVVTNQDFGLFLKMLTTSQEELEDQFVEKKIDISNMPTPLEFLLYSCYNNNEVEEIAKKAFFFFLKREVAFLYNMKIIAVYLKDDKIANGTTLDDFFLIKEENFFDFQNKIREVCGMEMVERPDPNLHPKIKAMKAKARLRDRIKAKQGGGINLTTTLVAICCMGIGITPLNIGELSYASLSELIRMYQEKEKYHLDVDSLLAGADSKKIKPKYWIRNLD